MTTQLLLIHDQFSTMTPFWINLWTVLRTLFSIGLAVAAILLSYRLSYQSTALSNSIKEQTQQIAQQTEAINTNTNTVLNNTKTLRLEAIRFLYEFSRERSAKSYWHFRWRFEAFDQLSGGLYYKADPAREIPETLIGNCTLSIVGFSVAPDHLGFENRESEFYKSTIEWSDPCIQSSYPFKDGADVACFHQGGNVLISKGVDLFEHQEKYIFKMFILGRSLFFHGERNVDTIRIYPRIKSRPFD